MGSGRQFIAEPFFPKRKKKKKNEEMGASHDPHLNRQGYVLGLVGDDPGIPRGRQPQQWGSQPTIGQFPRDPKFYYVDPPLLRSTQTLYIKERDVRETEVLHMLY